MSLKVQCEEDRIKDRFYCMLVHITSLERSKLCAGIRKLVLGYTRHPAVCAMANCKLHAVEQALIIAAMYNEPDFLAYILDQPGVCPSAISQFVTQIVPPLIKRLLDGHLNLPDFVAECVHAYVTL